MFNIVILLFSTMVVAGMSLHRGKEKELLKHENLVPVRNPGFFL